jgi:anti-anti-sigma factor
MCFPWKDRRAKASRPFICEGDELLAEAPPTERHRWAQPEEQGESGPPAGEEMLERAIVGLQISIRESGDVTILDLQGRATIGVDSDLVSSHLQKLVAHGVRKLLLNLAALTKLDSSGITAITGTYVSLSRQGGSLKLLRPCGRVRAVLGVIRLLDLIPTFEDETQALASFRPQGYSARP